MAREISTVLLTGASGFVGHEVEQVLRRESWLRTFTVLRPDSESANSAHLGSLVFRGELTDKASIAKIFKHKVDAIIHLVGIIAEDGTNTFEKAHVETTANLVDLAVEHKVQKFVHMSALGTRQNASSRYHQTKYRAEQKVKESGLNYTIIRPSVIFGSGCEFMGILEFLAKFPGCTPLLGEGKGRLQPVWVRDVARIFAKALTEEVTDGKTYDLGGPDVYSMSEMLKVIESHLGYEKTHCQLPSWVASRMASSNGFLWPVLRSILHKGSFALLAGHLLPPTINEDQLIMMEEDNTCDIEPVRKDFGVDLRSLADWLKEGGLEAQPWSKLWAPRYKGDGPTHGEPDRSSPPS